VEGFIGFEGWSASSWTRKRSRALPAPPRLTYVGTVYDLKKVYRDAESRLTVEVLKTDFRFSWR
jgi:hypothetical protein